MRKPILLLLCGALSLAMAAPASADPDKDESGHGHHGRGSYKETFRDGPCKIERKWDRHGGYKEERKCKGHGHHLPPVVHVPAPAPGVYVYPSAVVIQPPPIVIR